MFLLFLFFFSTDFLKIKMYQDLLEFKCLFVHSFSWETILVVHNSKIVKRYFLPLLLSSISLHQTLCHGYVGPLIPSTTTLINIHSAKKYFEMLERVDSPKHSLMHWILPNALSENAELPFLLILFFFNIHNVVYLKENFKICCLLLSCK